MRFIGVDVSIGKLILTVFGVLFSWTSFGFDLSVRFFAFDFVF